MKLLALGRRPEFRRALRHGVAAAVEHERIPLADRYGSILDIGANRGQFATFARARFPTARLYCFEPLAAAAEKLRTVTSGDDRVSILPLALGAGSTQSRRLLVPPEDDSSSLLAATALQRELFPGTAADDGVTVAVERLDAVLRAEDLPPPTLMKIDVQGFELEVLEGATGLLGGVHDVAVESSFVDLYEGGARAEEVVCLLAGHGFRLLGVYSLLHDRRGRCLQGDLLFRRRDAEA